jgi:hypothetical protein
MMIPSQQKHTRLKIISLLFLYYVIALVQLFSSAERNRPYFRNIENAYNFDSHNQMETLILNKLEWQTNAVTPLHFLSAFLELAMEPEEVEHCKIKVIFACNKINESLRLCPI